MRSIATALVTVSVAALSAGAGSGDARTPVAAAKGLMLQAQALPPGHPTPNAADAVPPVPPGAGSGEAGLTWATPRDWKTEPPSSSMRRAQYRVPGPGGDAECVVFYFGPGQGGDATSNAVRWAGQFHQPDGASPASALKTTDIEVGDLKVTLVDVKGTYSGGMGGGVGAGEKPGYQLVGAIAAGPDANWFFKLTGPEETVTAQRAAFERMIRSLKKGS
jgi:hypothetical protein